MNTRSARAHCAAKFPPWPASAAGALVLCCALAPNAVAAWTAQVLWVQGYGVDAAGCGTQTNPCRSITHALAAAQPGATIQVGPGRYGDVNRNGAYDLGDEGPVLTLPEEGRQAALLRIAKSARIHSTHGAEVTTIDIGPRPTTFSPSMVTVRIAASDVELGAVGHGFRVVGGSYFQDQGIVAAREVPVRNVRISGNVVMGPGHDTVSGDGIQIHGAHESVLVTDNQVSGFANGIQFALSDEDGAPAGGPATATRNTVRDNGNGGVASGRPIAFSGNIFQGNRGVALVVDDDSRDSTVSPPGAVHPVVDNNYIVANGEGLRLWGGSSVVRNAIIGNLAAGLMHGAGTVFRIELNNFYGNGLIPHIGTYEGDTWPTNCALVIDQYRAEGASETVAVNNYWGAATGPGPDPADDEPCVPSGLGTPDTPFATAPFYVPVPPKPAAPPR
jgi:hypothetical protein